MCERGEFSGVLGITKRQRAPLASVVDRITSWPESRDESLPTPLVDAVRADVPHQRPTPFSLTLATANEDNALHHEQSYRWRKRQMPALLQLAVLTA